MLPSRRTRPQPGTETRLKATPPAPAIWLWGVVGVGIILLPLFWAVLWN
jgi:hypothetical protein